MRLLRAVVRGEGVTALVTTHDPTLMELADRVLDLRDGQIVQLHDLGRGKLPYVFPQAVAPSGARELRDKPPPSKGGGPNARGHPQGWLLAQFPAP
jgi:ABC-type multidrug transport system ATPase subunit